jgi:hypothetical protein
MTRYADPMNEYENKELPGFVESSITTYSAFGFTHKQRLDGTVHGVVVYTN